MKLLGLETLRTGDVDYGDRLRQIDEARADLLAQNIREVGMLRQPIEVRATLRGRPYLLVAGGHRLRAIEILGWDEIPAFVYEMTPDEARLAEIDENLVRHELNPLDRAVFLAERKALYERLHPEYANGGDRRSTKFQTDIVSVWSFARDTAEKCGLTDRSIRRAVTIATGLSPQVRGRLAGTWLSQKQSELLALVKLAPAEQESALDLLLSETPQARTVDQATRLVRGGRASAEPDADQALSKLMRAWRDAPPPVKRAFLAAKMEDTRDTILRDFIASHAEGV